MPRNSGGTYSLPAGNPVVSGTVIESDWANTTMDDIAEALTLSLSREGDGGMLAPFLFDDGTEGLPGAAWVNEPSTGLYRAAAGDLRVTILAQKLFRFFQENAFIWDTANDVWQRVVASNNIVVNEDGTITFTSSVTMEGNLTVGGTLVFNEAQGLRPTVVNDTGTAYDLTATDENALLMLNNASPITVTVPLEATTSLPIGFITHLHQQGAGPVTIEGEIGVTVNSANSLTTRTQYASLSLFKVAEDSWVVVGDQL